MLSPALRRFGGGILPDVEGALWEEASDILWSAMLTFLIGGGDLGAVRVIGGRVCVSLMCMFGVAEAW